ncbi:MAG: sensor histidine kinase, partial [Sciscionella sp.]
AHVNRARGLAAEGLTETRRAVGALRGDTLPVTRLLAELARTHEADTGTPVAWVQGGVQRPLAPDVALALYRTGQEALSNARKHAPGAEVRVELDYRQDEVVLTVTDHPAGAPVNPPLAASGGGYGLTGLRERAELAGGGLSAGPEGGGWMLRLRLPA